MAKKYKKLTDYISLIEDDKFGECIIDKENDGTNEHPIQLPFMSYSQMVSNLVADIYLFEKENPEYRLNCYNEILEKNNINWSVESMLNVDENEVDDKVIMALFMGVVRAERFCDGVLLKFLKNGVISKWLKRLAVIDKES